MKTAIGDVAARDFSAQFSSATGVGLSAGRAFQEARAALAHAPGRRLPAVPEHVTSPGLDAEQLVPVQPDETPAHPKSELQIPVRNALLVRCLAE
jgi:hypothetical protein